MINVKLALATRVWAEKTSSLVTSPLQAKANLKARAPARTIILESLGKSKLKRRFAVTKCASIALKVIISLISVQLWQKMVDIKRSQH